jgi:hypothetical protein
VGRPRRRRSSERPCLFIGFAESWEQRISSASTRDGQQERIFGASEKHVRFYGAAPTAARNEPGHVGCCDLLRARTADVSSASKVFPLIPLNPSRSLRSLPVSGVTLARPVKIGFRHLVLGKPLWRNSDLAGRWQGSAHRGGRRCRVCRVAGEYVVARRRRVRPVGTVGELLPATKGAFMETVETQTREETSRWSKP